jgi:23S rRNA-/tRNA-specific pseudouridylate synthase
MRQIQPPGCFFVAVHLANQCQRRRFDKLRCVTVIGRRVRVHMAALGAPIHHDPLYPDLTQTDTDNFDRPLKLLAGRLQLIDPLNDASRAFECGSTL